MGKVSRFPAAAGSGFPAETGGAGNHGIPYHFPGGKAIAAGIHRDGAAGVESAASETP